MAIMTIKQIYYLWSCMMLTRGHCAIITVQFLIICMFQCEIYFHLVSQTICNHMVGHDMQGSQSGASLLHL